MKVGYFLYHPDNLETPVYVGVGTVRRGAQHWWLGKNNRHDNFQLQELITRLISEGKKLEWEFIREFEKDDDAYLWEASQIERYGRVDEGTGCLLNRTFGGPKNKGRKDTTFQLEKKKALWSKEQVSEGKKQAALLLEQLTKGVNLLFDKKVDEKRSRLTKEQMSHPEARKFVSDAATKQWADPEGRSKKLDGMRKANSQPEVVLRRMAAQKASKNRPEQKLRASVKQRDYHSSLTPEQKAERIEKIKAGMAAARARKLATSVEV